MLLFSCHADTGFRRHALERAGRGLVRGVLDNFVGVHAVMQAYFSGRLTGDDLRIELTYGEEAGCLGALEVVEELDELDVVVVVDVTATPTERDFVLEKCADPGLRRFVDAALDGMSYDLYADCPDPVSTSDETDVYVERCPWSFFLGLPVWGGDYNAEAVLCRTKSVTAVAEALCRLAEAYRGVRRRRRPVRGRAARGRAPGTRRRAGAGSA
jgi:hypothetical protein